MLRFISTVACTVACSTFVLAQGEPAGGPVKVTRIVDTPQTRVAQVEIQPNATRPLHNHPEALWGLEARLRWMRPRRAKWR